MTRALVTAARAAVSSPRSEIQHARSSLYFDGVDDVASSTTGHSCTGTSSFFCELWVMFPKAGSAFGVVVSVGNQAVNQGVYLGISHTTRKLTVAMHGFTGITSPVALDYGRWYHVVFDWDSANKRYHLCVNGGTVYTGTDVAAVPALTSHLWVGKATANPTPCYVHGLRLYKGRLLSQADCQKRMRGVRDDETGLDSRVLFNDGYGSTASDSSGNSRNLTVSGAVFSAVVPFRRRRVVEDVAAAIDSSGGAYVSIPSDARFSAGAGYFCVMGWWRAAVPAGGGYYIRKMTGTAGWEIIQDASSGPYANIKAGGVAENTTPSNADRPSRGDWTHLAMIIDRTASELRFHVNARRPTVRAITIGDITSASNIYCPAAAVGAALAAEGLVIVKGRLVTWDEIEAHCYNGEIPAEGSGTRTIWAAHDGSGTAVVSVPAGYNGTLSSASWTTSTRCKARVAA